MKPIIERQERTSFRVFGVISYYYQVLVATIYKLGIQVIKNAQGTLNKFYHYDQLVDFTEFQNQEVLKF